MTPARFDILYAIFTHHPDPHVVKLWGYQIPQATLTAKLGLARQTIFKMVERLIELKLITKSKAYGTSDERRNILTLTKEGIRRLKYGMGAAFSKQMPIPRDAPLEWPVPRCWRHPTVADRIATPHGERIPDPIGREVGDVFSRFAWKRTKGPRRGKHTRHLDVLTGMIDYARKIALALGDTSRPIYRLDYEPDH